MQAIILAIGDELVLGQTVDTNSAWLSEQLSRLGVMTRYHQTVADDSAAIAAAITWACHEAELVIVSGGLGPTDDDLTRHGLAEAMGQTLVLHEPSVAAIEAFFARRAKPMPQANRIQAMCPVGCEVIPNSAGTAPGLKAKLDRATVYVTPGVPREMVVMWQRSIAPEVAAAAEQGSSRGVILATKVNTFGQGESAVGEMLGQLMRRDRNPKVGTTVSGGVVSVRVRSEFPTAGEAHEQLDDTVRQVEATLGSCVYGRDDETLQAAMVALLRERGLTIATAESCTGGLVGAMLTEVPGSSAVYRGGWVTYTNEMKVSQLGLDAAMIATHGAVSQPVARAMAQAALEKSGADLALGITGIAGPDGGSEGKPVGLVWVALAWRKGVNARRSEAGVDALRLDLSGDRQTIRDRAAKCALQMTRYFLIDAEWDDLLWGRREKG